MHRQDLTVVRKEVYGRQTRDGKHLGSNFRNIYFGNRASYVLWNGPKHLRMMRTGSWSPWGEWGWRVGIAMSSAAPTTAFSLRVDDNSLSVKWSSGGFFVICERPLMRFVFLSKEAWMSTESDNISARRMAVQVCINGETSLTVEWWSQSQAGGSRERIWAHLKDVKG